MPDFEFESDKSTAENIAAFHAHLAEQEPEFAKLLSAELPALVPLPSPGAQRTARRAAFNQMVARHLDEVRKEEAECLVTS